MSSKLQLAFNKSSLVKILKEILENEKYLELEEFIYKNINIEENKLIDEILDFLDENFIDVDIKDVKNLIYILKRINIEEINGDSQFFNSLNL